MTPITHRARSVGEGIAAVVVIASLLVALYAGFWWLKRDVFNRDAQIRRDTFEQQTTYRDEAIRKMDDISSVDAQLADPALAADQRNALNAQRKAMVTDTCRIMTHLVGDTDPSISTFHATNC